MSAILSRHGHLSLSSLPKMLLGKAFRLFSHFRDGAFETFVQRAVQRRQLRALDDTQLKDIGVSRAEACWEAEKPFWRK